MDTKNLHQQIENLRYPSKITLGLKPNLSPGLNAEVSLSLTVSHQVDRKSGVPVINSLDELHIHTGGQLSKNKNSVRLKNIGKQVFLYSLCSLFVPNLSECIFNEYSSYMYEQLILATPPTHAPLNT